MSADDMTIASRKTVAEHRWSNVTNEMYIIDWSWKMVYIATSTER